jgi:hypothetical protein
MGQAAGFVAGHGLSDSLLGSQAVTKKKEMGKAPSL